MGVTNEFGEFPVPDDAESRRKEAYASLSRIDPAKAIGSKPCFPPKFDGGAYFKEAEEWDGVFEEMGLEVYPWR